MFTALRPKPITMQYLLVFEINTTHHMPESFFTLHLKVLSEGQKWPEKQKLTEQNKKKVNYSSPLQAVWVHTCSQGWMKYILCIFHRFLSQDLEFTSLVCNFSHRSAPFLLCN